MALSGDVTVACPHCGGGIKPAAKICKHCKRSVEVRQDHQSATTPALAIPGLPPVLLELRSFLSSKQFINLAAFDRVLAARKSNDASIVVRELVVVGSITQVQAEALVVEFGHHRMTFARNVVAYAHAQGLVPASHVEPAVASYGPIVFESSIYDHLVGLALLTRAQADGLALRPAPLTHAPDGPTSFAGPMRNLYIANVVALLVLLFALFSKTWWTSEDLHSGLLEAEACNYGQCETQSYSQFESMLGERPSDDFQAFIGDAKLTVIVGVLLVVASGSVIAFTLRRSRIGVIGLINKVGTSVFVLLVFKSIYSGHAMSYRTQQSMGYGPVLAVLTALVSVVIGTRIAKQGER